jgi:hypothetical protein
MKVQIESTVMSIWFLSPGLHCVECLLFGALCPSAVKLLSRVFCWDHGFASLCIMRALLIAPLSMPRVRLYGSSDIK